MARASRPAVPELEVDRLALVLITLEHRHLDPLELVAEPVDDVFAAVDHRVEHCPCRRHGPVLGHLGTCPEALGSHLRERPELDWPMAIA